MSDRSEPGDPAQRPVDIAVIGGGISGAYAVWRLKMEHPTQRIALFEYGDRIGGRLYSKTLPGMPHVRAELGGMRYIAQEHRLVAGLVKHLGLRTREFPMGAKGPAGASNNIVYLRGRLLRVRDLSDGTRLPYNLRPNEQHMNPDQLQSYVLHSLFPGADKFQRTDWYSATTFDGEPLYTLAFWNLLYRVLSSEGYQFMSDAGGYYTNASDANAASALPRREFLPTVEYLALSDGYDRLPLTLVEQFVANDGELHTNHRLAAIAGRGADGYRLTFARTRTTERGTEDADEPGSTVYNATQVILAMPRRSLELIEWEPLRIDPWLRRHIPSVIIQGAVKLFLAYEYPWWRSLGIESGRSITDMPIRQTYYFGTEGEMPGGEPANLNSLMMASYNDLAAVPFWKALEEGAPFEGRPNRFVAAGESIVPAHSFAMTRGLVRYAQEQVAEVHGLKYTPRPYSAIFQDWTQDPFGGGWHAWKAGFKFWEIMPRMRKPLPDEDVFICGEAYSNHQGWVEGALQTTELLLQDHFKLQTPIHWWPTDYDPGP